MNVRIMLRLVIMTSAAVSRSNSFLLQRSLGGSSRLAALQAPTKEQLASDPFIDQVSHAESLVSLLLKEEDKDDNSLLQDLLAAQLSHADGIRGFMVTYLTAYETAADRETVPPVLVRAMQQADPVDLIPLACMNVIMPTAMQTMHQDAELQEQSRMTATRGIRVLSSLLSNDNGEAKKQCEAILAVTNEEGSHDNKLHEYWKGFFEKWGYHDQQRKDIATAIQMVLSPSSS